MTLKAFTERLERMGASLTEGDYTHHAEAPRGYIWRSNGLTSVTIRWASNSQTWLTAALKEAVEDCCDGLQKCSTEQTEDIDFSHGLGAHSWTDDPQPSWAAAPDAPDRISWK